MNKCELVAAMTAWNLAIQHALSIQDGIDLHELAHSYGKAISTPENIDAASHMFNWNQLMNIIESVEE